MIRSLSKAFRTDPNGVNLSDVVTGTSQWTGGATILDTPDYTFTQLSEVTQIAFIVNLAFAPTGLNIPSFGALGRLYGGILPGNRGQTRGTGAAPWVNPGLPLPPDPSLLVKIWDGQTDQPPPQTPVTIASGQGNSLPFTAILALPNPIAIKNNPEFLVGLWLTSALVQKAAVFADQSSYTITYDDGVS